MSGNTPHTTIAEVIKSTFEATTTDLELSNRIYIEDFNGTEEPQLGITISALGEQERYGTNERDDIEYSFLITRSMHAIGNDDFEGKARFRNDVRLAFNHKRIVLLSCAMYTRYVPGDFAIPQAWKSSNKSVTALRVTALVREIRTRD